MTLMTDYGGFIAKCSQCKCNENLGYLSYYALHAFVVTARFY